MECKVWGKKKKNLLPRILNKISRNGLNRRVKYFVAFNLISCNWVTVIICTKIWVSAEFKVKTSHIASLLTTFPHCSLVKIEMTFVPIISDLLLWFAQGCLPSFCCLVLCVAGVPAGRVRGVLIDGAWGGQKSNSKGSEGSAGRWGTSWGRTPGPLEKEGCRASSGVTVFPSALTPGPQHCPGTNGNPSPGLAARLEPRGCVGTAGESRNSVSTCSVKFDTWKIRCC